MPLSRDRGRGQILVLFAAILTILLGFSALVVDLSWVWVNQLRVQRAADAAALAGVVYLPGDVPLAYDAAHAESRKNGYRHGFDDSVVTPAYDSSNPRQLEVTVAARIDTFFIGLFGFHELTVQRSARAEYVLPVPMGSPQNYYGVGHLVDFEAELVAGTWRLPGDEANPDNWSNPGRVYNGNTSDYATKNSTSNPYQGYTEFDLDKPSGATLRGIEVEVYGRASSAGCRLGIELTSNAGSSNPSWTSTNQSILMPSGSGSGADQVLTIGGDSALWGRSCSNTDLDDGNFGVRVAYIDPPGGCSNGSTISLRRIQVRLHYEQGTLQDPAPIFDPHGTAELVPQNFWGAMQSQGSPAAQGDAHMTGYSSRSPSLIANAQYDPVRYYNYGVEIPGGSGEVWIFDPGFCDVATGPAQGTGEFWTGDASDNPISAFYDLYDTKNTPYDYGDDGLAVASSGNTFRRLAHNDPTLGGSGGPSGTSSCAGLAWHNGWWQAGSRPGTGYLPPPRPLEEALRLGRQPDELDRRQRLRDLRRVGQRQPPGLRARRDGGVLPAAPGPGVGPSTSPRSRTAPPASWLDIDLWDPGNTHMRADLQILRPSTGGYVPAQFSYTAERGTTHPNASNCDDRTETNVYDGPNARRVELPVRWLLGDDRGPAAGQLRRSGSPWLHARGRVVADPLHHGREQCDGHRSDHLEGGNPGQPGPPGQQLGCRRLRLAVERQNLPAPVALTGYSRE